MMYHGHESSQVHLFVLAGDAGNFDYDCSVREIEKLMEKFGPVKNIDMKTGEAPSPLWHTVVMRCLQSCGPRRRVYSGSSWSYTASTAPIQPSFYGPNA